MSNRKSTQRHQTPSMVPPGAAAGSPTTMPGTGCNGLYELSEAVERVKACGHGVVTLTIKVRSKQVHDMQIDILESKRIDLADPRR